jgi:anti-sigma B factor antagonist
MKVEHRLVGDVALIGVSGDIALNAKTNILFKEQVQALIRQGHKKILLDLGGVAYVDSAGLSELVHAYATARNRGGSLKLLNVPARLRQLLAVTKLLTLFDAYESEPEALASFVGSEAELQ